MRTLPGSVYRWSPRNERQKIWRHRLLVQREADTQYPGCRQWMTPWWAEASHGQRYLSLATFCYKTVKKSILRTLSCKGRFKIHAFIKPPKPEKGNQPTSTLCGSPAAVSQIRRTWLINNSTHSAGLAVNLAYNVEQKAGHRPSILDSCVHARNVSWMQTKDATGTSSRWSISGPGREGGEQPGVQTEPRIRNIKHTQKPWLAW